MPDTSTIDVALIVEHANQVLMTHCLQAKFEQKGDFVAKKRAPKKRKKKLLVNQVQPGCCWLLCSLAPLGLHQKQFDKHGGLCMLSAFCRFRTLRMISLSTWLESLQRRGSDRKSRSWAGAALMTWRRC